MLVVFKAIILISSSKYDYFLCYCGEFQVGKWDGAGVVLKSRLRHEQCTNPLRQLQNAAKVVNFLYKSLSMCAPSSYRNEKSEIQQNFWLIEEVDKSMAQIARPFQEADPYIQSLGSYLLIPPNLWYKNFPVSVTLACARIGRTARL